MAVLDVPHGAVRLADDELGTSVVLAARPDHPSLAEPGSLAALERLEAGGVVVDGELVGYVERLVGVVARPGLRISIERFVGDEPVLDQAWATEAAGVLGRVCDDGQVELSPVEPALLPWALARIVGLGPRERAAVTDAVRLPAAVLEAVVARLGEGDDAGAQATLAEEAGLEGPEREALVLALRDRRVSWRATSTWTDPEQGPQVGGVAVLDGGLGGLWLSAHEGHPDAPVVRLEPTTAGAVWNALVALLPHPLDEPSPAPLAD